MTIEQRLQRLPFSAAVYIGAACATPVIIGNRPVMAIAQAFLLGALGILMLGVWVEKRIKEAAKEPTP